jgi:hypothetical protein
MILLMILRSFKDSLLEVASLDPAYKQQSANTKSAPQLEKEFLFPRLRRFRPRFI